MISRRNVRIKVMQLLYSIDANEGVSDKQDPVKLLSRMLDQTGELLAYLLYYITEVARYAEKDARHRASKNLATAADRNVNIKIAGNEIVWQILENDSFRERLAKYQLAHLDNHEEMVHRTYQQLVDTDIYKSYIAEEGRTKKAETALLEFIFSDLMLINEDFNSFLLENFPSWDDDADMLGSLVISILHKPASLNFNDLLPADTWDFGKSLLSTVKDKKAYLTDIIKPKLNNWDSERIAIIDMILLQMGVAELLYFDTIPPKVTINEYIDIAKEYSTEQSGQFINGILDSIRKELEANNKLHKTEFRKK